MALCMALVEHSKHILSLLNLTGSSGLRGSELKRLSSMSNVELEKILKALWDQGYLSGVRDESCCGSGCRFMCVSYMDENRKWMVIE
ncbi:hypothetical protein TDB9533_03323 [Thalassocella blandensis]|nr:hypothetical protein TDB9533_03323 [Thalassocella blandensis]